MDKNTLRKQIKADREALTPDFVVSASGKIAELFLSMDIVSCASDILAYSDFRNEVRTGFLLSELVRAEKNVYLPKTSGDDIIILPYRPGNLEKGQFGITEPKMDASGGVPYDCPDIIVVPGIAFDKKGGRIGFGRGYYDRLLAGKKKECRTIALAYEMQLVDNVFSEPHDVPVNYIITEKQIYYAGEDI